MTASGQFNSHNLGIAFNAVYTTSADIYLNPNASDVIARNQSQTLEDILNPSVEIRYRIFDEIIIGLSSELMRKTIKTEFRYIKPNLDTLLQVNEGFEVIPIEITVHYYFPFSVEDFKFQMGGGVGYYWGRFIREFESANTEVVKRKVAVGIHVSTTMDYMIFDFLSARFEMKFREIQYNVKSIYQTNNLELPPGEFETRVDVNGLAFLLGLVYHL
jgi:outer membrane protein W